jgi:hypothetical protein
MRPRASRCKRPTLDTPISGCVQHVGIDPHLYTIDPKTLPAGTPTERWFRDLVEHLQRSLGHRSEPPEERKE